MEQEDIEKLGISDPSDQIKLNVAISNLKMKSSYSNSRRLKPAKVNVLNDVDVNAQIHISGIQNNFQICLTHSYNFFSFSKCWVRVSTMKDIKVKDSNWKKNI